MTDLKIEYKPHRGKSEPVLRINIAKLIFHTNYLEIQLSYDFEYKDEEGRDKMKEVRSHLFIPKIGLSFERTVVTHNPDDHTPVIIIDSPSISDPFYVWVAEELEIKDIMNALKSWVL